MATDWAQSFPPIARAGARVLILGSMPGRASLSAQQYYAFPRNAFWPVMAALIGLDLKADYPVRCTALMNAGIAIWDVLAGCERPGSLDSAIVSETVVANDFGSFLAQHPALRCIAFNGLTAQTEFRKRVMPDLDEPARALVQLRLPSTSPANAGRTLAQKTESWRALLEFLADG
ncbi:MAG: DNA-deoxyinosine glycosylase [Pseudomonadota bacterium]